ncbi:glycosyltransferase [Picosynechococcus sp. PCC 11901]|uniref:glycosyltransferase family 2 protein n=1 Tax=Picosynechococcus sp. PCC 11901 TaxID=2579791 RepID=UPI0010FC2F5F|nr:glycosyltransferase family 2 protein [Picosynechococcus sp. PCC 11901]QCS50062.1 glycosyltransferase [Picosynechococcus sp. PCC 11901]
MNIDNCSKKVNDNGKISNVIFPRISIITPSYNQGSFIEETICSVIKQGYPNLEYIIIDGGSTDNTSEIIKRYEQWITYWVSEPDNGQTHAINKGLAKATGEIIAYLNSDDYYLPGTLFKVAEHFRQFPDTDLLHGICRYVNEEGEKIGEQFGKIKKLEEILDLWDVWWKQCQFVQPEIFWTRRITDKIGLFKEELNFVMDYDYWLRILEAEGTVGSVNSEFSCFRFTSDQKSNQSEKVAEELLQVVHPFLWSNLTKISPQKQRLLRGKWLYQSVFLKQVEISLTTGEPKAKRYFNLLKIMLNHPGILLTFQFRQRIKDVFLGTIYNLSKTSGYFIAE